MVLLSDSPFTPSDFHCLGRFAVTFGRPEITRILERVEQGDGKVAEELLPLVYYELRKLAAARMAHEAAGQTLQASALVHEAWLRLVGAPEQNYWSVLPGHQPASRSRA